MAKVTYTGLTTPDDILNKIYDYVVANNYNIIQVLTNDLDVYTKSYVDGNKFCFEDANGEYYIVLRSVNGTYPFGVNDESTMDVTTPDVNSAYTGIAMTAGEGYSNNVRWYNQLNVPLVYNSNEVIGVYMPVNTNYSYTLHCNRITDPTDTLIFSIVKEDDDYMPCAHLVVGNLSKFGTQIMDFWEGGIYISGSAATTFNKTFNIYDETKRFVPKKGNNDPALQPYTIVAKELIRDSILVFERDVNSDKYIRPILSSGMESNTFLRINIDNAPAVVRGKILWASSGIDNLTGKPLSLPVRLLDVHDPDDTNYIGTNGVIPNYYYLQSKSRLDWGRNINTLNCLTIDMPLYMAVQVDPDARHWYAAAGTVSGLYYVSTLNMQTGGIYERDYPESGIQSQVFPYGKRRGYYGFDGFSIKQEI